MIRASASSLTLNVVYISSWFPSYRRAFIDCGVECGGITVALDYVGIYAKLKADVGVYSNSKAEDDQCYQISWDPIQGQSEPEWP